METSLTILIILILTIVFRYIRPLLLHRLKTRKVKIVFVDESGCKKTGSLYLYPNDPLWKIVEAQKNGGENDK